MFTRTRKATGLAIFLAALAVGLTACGSGDDSATTTAARPPVSPTTADHLAKLSDRVADDLDAEQTCSAAIAADELKSAVESSDLPSSLRPGVETVATDLVDRVNCPPPPPPPEPEKKPKKGDEGPQGNDEQGNGEHGPGSGGHEHKPPGHSKQGGFAPPGHAKLEGQGE
jgi:hypothetical protein